MTPQPSRLTIENYRGVPVPRTLGLWLAGGAAGGAAVGALVRGGIDPAAAGLLGGALLVGSAGLADDLVPGETRGLRNHVRALLDGRVTTGMVKLFVTVGASVVTVGLQRPSTTAGLAAGVILVAGTTNVVNGLDVRPGRALKGFLALAGGSSFALAAANDPILPTVLGTVAVAIPALAADLRERAMLGDSGANLLGFVAGVALFVALPDAALVPAAGLAVAANVVADTIGFSRLIDAVGPLRWLDRLGRLAANEPPEAAPPDRAAP